MSSFSCEMSRAANEYFSLNFILEIWKTLATVHFLTLFKISEVILQDISTLMTPVSFSYVENLTEI